MLLSAYASQRQYARHLEPIVDELRARAHDVECWSQHASPFGPAFVDLQRHRVRPLLLVASFTDAHRFRDRHLIYVEHGAGQTYCVADERLAVGFAGGGGLDHVALFVCPSERVAGRWRAVYPHARVEVVGSPALDRYVAGRVRASTAPPLLPATGRNDRPPSRPVVAFTCHWRFGGDEIPEGMPALPRYLPTIGQLDRGRYDLLATAHPKIASRARRWWADLDVPFVEDPDEILALADLLVADSTSLMYEAAAVGIPVLALNDPSYRRNVEHGLRWWSHVPGLQCDEPMALDWSIRAALADPTEARALRTRAVAHAYDHLDGKASARAADAILSLEGAPMPPPAPYNEIADRTEEVADRLYQLGATDDLVANVLTWDGDQIEKLRRMNDVRLRALVREALTAGPTEAVGPAPAVALPTEAELDDAALGLLAGSEDDALEAVGDDDELAARLFRLESAGAARPDLLDALAAIADIDYEPDGQVDG